MLTYCDRVCVIYRIVNMLIYFRPSAACELKGGLLIAPLPTSSGRWALDEASWTSQSRADSKQETVFGVAADGGLVELNESQMQCIEPGLSNSVQRGTRPAKHARWEEWCAGMDGLGTVVMLAASLIA